MDRRPFRALTGLPLACLIVVSATLTIAGSAAAFQADDATLELEIVQPLGQTRYLTRAGDLASNAQAAIYSNTLATSLGTRWRVVAWNQFSGTARSVIGEGIVVAPSGLATAERSTVEELARTFIAGHADLFATDGRDLITTKVNHGVNRWGVVFEQEVEGIRVDNTRVFVAIHDNGRLFAFGSHVYPTIDVPLIATIDATFARQLARDSVPHDPTLELAPGPDATVIVPIHRGVGDVSFHLAHRTDVPTTTPYGMWRTWIDAHTGEILYRDNQIEFAYEGSSGGDVEVFSPCDGTTPEIFPNMNIDIDGVGTAVTDDAGDFSIGGNSGTRNFTAEFNGPDFNVDCSDCGGDAELGGTIDPDSPESIYFGGSFREDERDAFHFSDRTRGFIESIDPGFSVPKYTVNVNLSGCCNATWGGTSVNFFRAGCGCENMARVSDVVAHEFGHGVQDWALGGGQGPEGLGEGNADIASTYITDNFIVGIGVVDCVSGARVCDNDLRHPEDLNGSIHHDGQIICGFNWDCRENLEPSMGFEGAKTHTATMWVFSRKLYMNNSDPQPDQALGYLLVDDDNGNLDDGTPNFDAICAAMMHHGFDCPIVTTAIDQPGPAASAPMPLELGAARPNPFNPSTTISFSLATESAVELSIFDVHGRTIRTLVNETRTAGAHVANWDGTAEGGVAAPSGIYYYRLEVGDWTDTRSMVLLK